MSRFLMCTIILILGLVATNAGAAHSVESLPLGQQQRSYQIYVPAGAEPVTGFPLLLAFHGGGMNGKEMEEISLLDQQADLHHFIVVYPDGIAKHWNDGRTTIKNPQDDVGFVVALLAQLEQRYHLDTRRIFATGISNGALFTERLGCELADKIAGIAAVAGTIPSELMPQCQPTQKLAVLQIDGNADPIMPYEGGTVNDFHGRGEGGQVSSVADTVAFWAKHNTCQSPGSPQPLAPLVRFDRTRIERVIYQGCPATVPVTVYTVLSGGHVWPGGAQPVLPLITGRLSRQMVASATIANFFMTLPMR